MHVTSLPSPYGIGDLGPAALAWVDRLHDAGQSWWQALPLGPTGYGNSPYSCLSSFAGNTLLVSPDLLIEDGLLSPTDCESGWLLRESTVDFEAVIAFKHGLLDQAWLNFDASERPELQADFERFCFEEAHWLDDYALFRALKSHLGGAHLLDWPQDLLRRSPSAMARMRRDLADHINESRFGQFLLSRQGNALKEYAHARGVLEFFRGLERKRREKGNFAGSAAHVSRAQRAGPITPRAVRRLDLSRSPVASGRHRPPFTIAGWSGKAGDWFLASEEQPGMPGEEGLGRRCGVLE